MGITIVIVLGVIALTAIAIVGDYLTKVKGAKSSIDPSTISELEKRIDLLEQKVSEQDKIILNLDSDIKFNTKLLEVKHTK